MSSISGGGEFPNYRRHNFFAKRMFSRKLEEIQTGKKLQYKSTVLSHFTPYNTYNIENGT